MAYLFYFFYKWLINGFFCIWDLKRFLSGMPKVGPK